MAGNSLGTAYVQVIPKLKGGSLVDMGRQAGAGFEEGFGSAVAKIAKIVAGAALTKAVIDFGHAAVDAYADFEQLSGGVETLFGAGGKSLEEYAASMGASVDDVRGQYDSLMAAQDTVLQNAQNAYMTAGLSANEYMETVTGFSAALINSLGGDTEAAARYADMAITDMSDNANKMGTDMESIQNAYQGFAKQNYTMLDNLKLGYGGTKEEMERLLADAEAISGVHYDIESYADVVDAIHVIQENMSITGTTALEAATTISGSWSMLEASWSNFLTSIAGGGDDIGTSVENVFASLGAWLRNLVPRIVEVARGIFEAMPAAAAEAMRQLPGLILDIVEESFGPEARDVALDFINTIHGIVSRAEEFVDGIMDALAPVTEFLTGQGEAFGGMMERIRGHLADLQPHLVAIKDLWDKFKGAVTALVEAVAPLVTEFLAQLGSGIVGLLPVVASVGEKFLEVATAIVDVITFLVTDAQDGFEGLRAIISEKWEAIKAKAGEVWEGIKSTISDKVQAARKVVTDLVEAIGLGVHQRFMEVRNKVHDTWEGIKASIVSPIERARDAVRSAIDKIKGFFSFKVSWPHIPLPHFSVTPAGWTVADLLKGTIPSLGISWYATGGVIDEPTLLAGVGERGPELVWPGYEPYLSRYADAITERVGDGGGPAVVRAIERLERNLGAIIEDHAPRMGERDFGRAVRRAYA